MTHLKSTSDLFVRIVCLGICSCFFRQLHACRIVRLPARRIRNFTKAQYEGAELLVENYSLLISADCSRREMKERKNTPEFYYLIYVLFCLNCPVGWECLYACMLVCVRACVRVDREEDSTVIVT